MSYRHNREKAQALADVFDGQVIARNDKVKQKVVASINRGKITGYACSKCKRAMGEEVFKRQQSFGLEPTCIGCIQRTDTNKEPKVKKGIYYSGSSFFRQ